MEIYYLLAEAVPCADNDESKEFGGAFINLWVQAEDESSAIKKAKEYISSEGWETVNIEEVCPSKREDCNSEPDLLECYDQAIRYGIGALFNTFPIEE